ncbi:hypothetical protein ABXJ56_00860 [Microbacterium chocolatum]|uniref:hypothetical protein n=1 Tax=Microbacterium aurantiacum TaxID=162393 RepID=UPI0033903A4C
MSENNLPAEERDRLSSELAQIQEQLHDSIGSALRVPGGALAQHEHQAGLLARANEIRDRLGIPSVAEGDASPRTRAWHGWLLWASAGTLLAVVLFALLGR